MLRFSSIIIILFLTLSSNATSKIDKGDSAYLNNDYFTAVKIYEDIIVSEGKSSELYYNLGNAYYRLGKLGKSIINYERALKFDPTNTDAKFNLSFVKTKTIDKEQDNGSYMEHLANVLIYGLSSNIWAVISFILFILILLAIVVYIFSTNILFRKIGFFGGGTIIILFIITIIFAFLSASKMNNNRYAIILDESVMLGTMPKIPETHSEEAFLLHEGAKVEIVDSVVAFDELWYEVKINNHIAWLKANAVERI